MNRFFALFAALALVFSPMTASAESAGCQMQAGREASGDMAMPMPMPMAHKDGGSKSSDPCCSHDKACAMACGQSCAPVAALPAMGLQTGVRLSLVRLNPELQREPVSRAPDPDRPPPRTIA